MQETFTVEAASLASVKDKVVLITGGSSGIGLATAELLLSLSPTNRVAVLDRAPLPPSLASPASAGRVLFHQCDITDWKAQRAGFEAAASRFGRLDVVFANAGINERGDQFFGEELDGDGKLREPDRSVMEVTYLSVADTVKLGIHYLRRNGSKGGSIIITASFAGYIGSAGAPYYTSAKHAVVGLLRSLKADSAKLGIAVSVVAPAVTITPMVGTLDGTETPKEVAARLSKGGLTINSAETVALAVGHLIQGGIKSSGAGLLVQNDRMVDMERGYAKSRESIMGKEMLDYFRSGLKVQTYQRLDEKAKI
ncbi:putative oxidoreductase,short chain dehydrogenase [Xylariales sp. PMI_506]|nr:putative oxidoreductase,short chain dehydrogenase [Xylariales sp. PMI_506]